MVAEAGARPVGTTEEAMPAVIRLRWVSVAEASSLLGISEVAVRKRLADGALTGIRIGRGWKVLLAGEVRQAPSPPDVESAPPPVEHRDDESMKLLAQTSEALGALVRDLQRQSLSLAAQIGYLQSQLAEAQSQVKLLTERNQDAVDHDGTRPSRAEYEAAQDTIATLRAELAKSREAVPPTAPERRGWRFWRR